MSDQATSLVVGVDTTQVMTGKDALEAFAKSGVQAQKSAAGLEAAAKAAAAAAPGVSATAAALSKAQREQRELASATKLSAYQTQQLGYQLNDLFVQIASGQSPLTAIIQQGSQLSGTFGGVGGALRAVGSIFTLTSVSVGGAAAAIGAFAYLAYQGAERADDLRRSLQATNNAAGLTQGRFSELGKSIAESTGSTVADVKTTLGQLAASGQVSGEALSETAKAIQLVGKATGQTSESVAKEFLGYTSNIARGAEQLNARFNFLDATQLRYIKTLAAQGEQQKAVAFTMAALSNQVKDAATDVGLLDRAWASFKATVSDGLEAVRSIGAPTNIDKELEAAEKRASILRGLIRGDTLPAFGDFSNPLTLSGKKEALAQEEALIRRLKESKALADQVASSQAARAEANRAAAQFDKLREQSLSRQEKLAEELATANALADKSGASAESRARVLAAIREKYSDKGAASRAAAEAKAALALDIDSIQQASRALLDSVSNREAILDATRSAGLVSESNYYATKRQLLEESSTASINAFEQELQRLRQEKLTGADRINNQRAIAKVEAEITKAREDFSTKAKVLELQEAAALKAKSQALDGARIAAEQYLATLQRQNSRDLAALPLGDRARSDAQARNQIDDRYLEQRQRLAEDLRRGQLGPLNDPETKQRYEAELAIIDRFNTEALASYEERMRRQREIEGQASTGASRAIQNYLDNAQDVAKQTEQVFSRGFAAMEEALVNFVKTGKVDFKSLADSIINELLRIEAKKAITGIFSQLGGAGGILGSVASLFGGTSGQAGLASALPGDSLSNFLILTNQGGRAIGGPVSARSMYEVNEKGRPEIASIGGRDYLLTGSQSGAVKAANEVQAPQVVNHFNIGGGVTRNELMAMVPAIEARVQASVQAKSMRPGAR